MPSGTPRADTPFYNWGASFGGPICIPKIYDGHHKTFFWLSTESYRQKSPLYDDYALPTALERHGNYSQSSNTIYDPLTSHPCTAAANCAAGQTIARTAFPGNIIPSNRINPVGAAALSYPSLPRRATPTGSNNLTGTDTLTDRADETRRKWIINCSAGGI